MWFKDLVRGRFSRIILIWEAEGNFITVINVKTEEDALPALKMEEETVNQEIEAASKNWKRKEIHPSEFQ